jgi:hypothetical protein
MFFSLLEWALRVVIATFVLLLLAILLWFVWDALMGVFHGPSLSYVDVAVIAAIISVGNWGFSLLQRRQATGA